MNTNRITIISSIVIIFLILGITTSYKVIKNYHKNLYVVIEKEVIDATKKCILEEKCNKGKIYLKDLYDLDYLDVIYNPVTKEKYNDESYIQVKNDEYKFVIKND